MSKDAGLFAAVRKMLGRGLTQAEVDELNDVMSGRVAINPPSLPERSNVPGRTSCAGMLLIQEFESCAQAIGGGQFQAYPDPAPGSNGLPVTIGWGSTRDFNGNPIKMGTVWTQAQCDRKKAEDMEIFERNLLSALGSAAPATSQPQFDAMVSLIYNIGPANFRSSTLLRKHTAGDYAGAAAEFARWNKAAGRVMRGLTRRREAEAKLYRSGT